MGKTWGIDIQLCTGKVFHGDYIIKKTIIEDYALNLG